MIESCIVVRGARTHNLKNIMVEIPKHRFVVFTGVSGSGKSSLVFDTLYTEAQRQLVETFSTFARSRLPKLSRPDMDEVTNLSTAILIDQKPMGSNLRSTLGTATEILTYLRLLFSRLAQPQIGPSFLYSFNHPEGMCPTCHGLGTVIEVNRERLLRWDRSLRDGALDHPECRPGGFLWRELVSIGLFDPDKPLSEFTPQELHLLLDTEAVPVTKPHGVETYIKNWEGFARRLVRLKTAKGEAEGTEPVESSRGGKKTSVYEEYFSYGICPDCSGHRINARARESRIRDRHIGQLCAMELADLLPWLEGISDPLGQSILPKARILLQGLIRLGLGYLTLERPVSTLSGGESQRVKTARQLDCDLTDLLYILDEPSAGLHPRDTEAVLALLRNLRDRGNTVLVVEHDPTIIRGADWVVDLGPSGGAQGGEVVYVGSPGDLHGGSSITGRLLQDEAVIPSREEFSRFYEIHHARTNNLQDISVKIPQGAFTCITGVSGSGKSTLMHQEFIAAYPEAVVVDQGGIGRTSRGNLITYTGMFDAVRRLFSKATGQAASLFSFNSQGACQKCGGQGVISTELFFLDAVQTPCDECQGKRYRPEVLSYRYAGVSIDEVLEMTAHQALELFSQSKIKAQLELLIRVGLGYLKLGQALSTLSGGEAQRLKLAARLSTRGQVYILDEPTRGLHRGDIQTLHVLIQDLVGAGNTVVVIEHNMDIVKYAQWIVDLGPGAGKEGGRVLYQGPAAGLLGCRDSRTAKYLSAFYRTS